MIEPGNRDTYCFHRRNENGLHLGRFYISKVRDVRKYLDIVKRKKIVSDTTLKNSGTTIRSENPREFLELLWLLNDFGIEVTRHGREVVFVPNTDLDKILELSDIELKKLVLKKLKMYAPFVAVLDKMTQYKNANKKFTQKNITADFSEGNGEQTTDQRTEGNYVELKNLSDESIFVYRGDGDNTEPLCRIANDDEDGFGLVDKAKKEINKNGEKYVQQSLKMKYLFFDYNVDLDSDPALNIITHILAKTSKKIKKKTVLKSLKKYHEPQFTLNDLNENLDVLISKKIPITYNDDEIIMNEKIFHRITKKDYAKFDLHKIDKIQLPTLNTTSQSDVEIDDSIKIIIIMDAVKDSPQSKFFKPENYPECYKILTYYEFKKFSESLPDSNVNTIIIPSLWNPSQIGNLQGILLSFVRLGGNLIVENMNTHGRTGVNVNRYFWLPHDLKSIGSTPVGSKLSKENPNLKGVFTFHDDYGGENLTYSKKMSRNTQKIQQGYMYLSVEYYSGKIIFSALKNYKNKITHLVRTNKNFKIDSNDPQWKYNWIPNIKTLPRVNTERQIYPHLKKIFNEYFGLKSESLGASGETDVMISKPFSCCCEVGTFSQEVSGSEKIGEVARHRKEVDRKNQDIKNEGNKPPYHDDIGCCVIAVSYSKENSISKSGAIDSALHNNVSLLTYMDIYELVCLNEKYKLNDEELKKIFFYQDDKSPEAAERIYELIKEKTC